MKPTVFGIKDSCLLKKKERSEIVTNLSLRICFQNNFCKQPAIEIISIVL